MITSNWRDIVIAGMFGAIVVCAVHGIDMLNPLRVNWLMHGDTGTHFMGWHFFRFEPWGFPLGKIANYGWPLGTTIGFTDSIPLLAIPLKSISAFLPVPFQYIGLWLLLCYVLQGVFGSLLIGRFTQNRWHQWIGALFWVTSPVLLIRTGHPALCAQWVIVAALWLYFAPLQKAPRFRNWSLLLGISAAIHPYLAVMAMGLATAFYLRLGLIDKMIRPVGMLTHLGGLAMIVLLIWLGIGYFQFGNYADYGAVGYGTWSMNLLAPINPSVGIDNWPVSWSRLLPEWPLASWEQCGGFNFLGTGMILLVIMAVVALTIKPPNGDTVRRWTPVLIVCIGFSLFALSNRITLGKTILVEYPLPLIIERLCSVFHASGRFFWPTYYLVFLLGMVVVIRRLKIGPATMLLLLGLIVQTADSTAQYAYIHHAMASAGSENPLTSEFWEDLDGRYRHFVLVPPDHNQWPYLWIAYMAANQKATINVSYTARYDSQKQHSYTKTLLVNVANGVLDDETLYIIHPDWHQRMNMGRKLPTKPIDGFWVLMNPAE